MSFEELSIFIFAALCGLAAMFYIDAETCTAFCLKLIGHREDTSQNSKPSLQFTIPPIPTYRGNSILESRNTNKTKAETAIKTIYTRAGLKEPLIIWTQSPLANVFAKVAIDYFSHLYYWPYWESKDADLSTHNDHIRASAWQSVRNAGWNIGDRGTGDAAWCDVKLYEYRNDICWGHIPPAVMHYEPNGLEGMRQNNAWFDIGNIVDDRSSGDWLLDLYVRLKFEIRYPDSGSYIGRGRQYREQIRQYKRKLRHQKNLNCLPPQVPDTDHYLVSHPTDMRSEFQILRDAAGWVMPYTQICFVSERPQHLELDDSERLHCETGPAMIYPDGFMVHAWHGTVIPEKWIEDKPTASEALYWRNTEQRRAACEMLGWEAILSELDCVSLDKDKDPEIGELVSVNIPHQGEDKFLRVTCGTGRNFALPVPPEMTTARQANAWTWGLEPDQYNPEIRT